jgi:hypothetical protein
MARYVSNPIEVDAFQIKEVWINEVEAPGIYHLVFDDGASFNTTPDMTSRMIPKEGDYVVKTHTPDEYVYLNPAHVFEAKYTKVE